MRVNVSNRFAVLSLQAGVTQIEQFLKIARRAPKLLRIVAEHDVVRLEVGVPEDDNDVASILVRCCDVVEPGEVVLRLPKGLELLRSLESEGRLIGNHLAFEARSCGVDGTVRTLGSTRVAIRRTAPTGVAPAAAIGSPTPSTSVPADPAPADVPDIPGAPAEASPAEPVAEQQSAEAEPTPEASTPEELPSSEAPGPRRISVDARVLKAALARVVYPRKDTRHIEVLRNVALVMREELLELSGTDLETAIVVKLPGQVLTGGEPSACLADGAQLKSQVRYAKKGETVELSIVGRDLELVTGGRKATLLTMPLADFPPIPDMADLPSFVATGLPEALGDVVDAASTDESRFAVSGIMVRGREVVATDGHRLHRRSIQGDGASGQGFEAMLLPLGRGLDVLMELEGSIVGRKDDKNVSFETRDTRVVMRVKQETFPSYDKVIPKPDELWHELPLPADTRVPWIEALKRLPVSPRTAAVRIRLNGQIEMESGGEEMGNHGAVLPGTLTGGGEVTFSVNRNYLVDALARGVEVLYVKKPDQQFLLRNDRLDVVIMPLRT